MKLDENMTFEAAMTRLEEIVRLLESGNAPLDVSLSLYEEGVALVRLCNTRLDNAEQRVKIRFANGNERTFSAVAAPIVKVAK